MVAPISRVVDDTTVYQLLSRYGKAFKGMVSVICTHSDAGLIGSERKMVNHLQQEDKDVELYHELSDKMKAKELRKMRRRAFFKSQQVCAQQLGIGEGFSRVAAPCLSW